MIENGHNGNGNGTAPSLATPASEWRRNRLEGYTITLPSGNKATIKSVALDRLVQEGKIPDFLTGVAAQSLWADPQGNDIAKDEELSKQYLELIDFVVPLAFVSPKIVREPDIKKEEITVQDVDFMDRICVFNLSIQPSGVLKNFRDEQEKRLATIRDSEDNILKTVGDNRD